MKLGLFHFQLLYQILERIHYIYDEEELAQSVLESISTALNAEGATIFRLRADKTLYPLAGYGVPLDRLRNMPFTIGKGVVGWVVEHAQPVKVDNCAQDPRFGVSVDALTGFKTRSILASPVIAKGQVVGVIEFLNKKEGPFTIPDLELVSMIGREVGIAFENASLIRDLRHTRALLDATTNSFSAGILVVDQSQNLLRMNPSAQIILALAQGEKDLVGKSTTQFLAAHPDFLEAVRSVIASADPLSRKETRITTGKGERIIGYSGVPVKDSNNERLGSALLFQDITAYVKDRPAKSVAATNGR